MVPKIQMNESSNFAAILEACKEYINENNSCYFVNICVGDMKWGELQEILPTSGCRPYYKDCFDLEYTDNMYIGMDRVIFRAWDNVDRFFRILSFREYLNGGVLEKAPLCYKLYGGGNY